MSFLVIVTYRNSGENEAKATVSELKYTVLDW
jgi:hypothetical protein